MVFVVSSSMAWIEQDGARSRRAPSTTQRIDFGKPSIISRQNRLKTETSQDLPLS
jgi:hypothetical protein